MKSLLRRYSREIPDSKRSFVNTLAGIVSLQVDA